MATFRLELDKNFKTIDEKEMSGIDGYKAIHYACNWLSNYAIVTNSPLSNAKTTYTVHLAKRDSYGLYRYYCTVYVIDGSYRKMVSGKGDYPINSKTGRTITKRKKTIKKK